MDWCSQVRYRYPTGHTWRYWLIALLSKYDHWLNMVLLLWLKTCTSFYSFKKGNSEWCSWSQSASWTFILKWEILYSNANIGSSRHDPSRYHDLTKFTYSFTANLCGGYHICWCYNRTMATGAKPSGFHWLIVLYMCVDIWFLVITNIINEVQSHIKRFSLSFTQFLVNGVFLCQATKEYKI